MVLGLDAGILLVAVVVAAIALVLVVNGVILPEIGSAFVSVMVNMPKFNFGFTGGDGFFGESGNENFHIYERLRIVSFIILGVVGTLSAGIVFLEQIELFPKGTALDIIGKGVMLIPFFLIFPLLWDNLAFAIEELAKYILNPDDPSNPGANVEWVFRTLGAITPPDVNWDDVLEFLTNPGEAGQVIFRDVFLSVFKALIAAILTFTMYMIGTIRIVLTAVLMTGIPIILALNLVPWFKKATTPLINTLLGLMLAPIFSALTIVTGQAYIQAADLPPLLEWIATAATAMLAVGFPSILAPVLGGLTSQVTGLLLQLLWVELWLVVQLS